MYCLLTAMILHVAGGIRNANSQPASPSDDYTTHIQPIFDNRCVACHSASNNAFKLQPLAEGATWTEEQSRRNFESVSKLVNKTNPKASLILMHPLAHEAGGDEFHSGGRQFLSKDDPGWKAIAAWIGVTE